MLLLLTIIFAVFYTVRFYWERYPIGRAIIAALVGTLIESLGDLAHNVGWQRTGDVLTIIGNVWLSVLFVICAWYTGTGSITDVVQDLPPLETRPKPGDPA